MTLVFELLSKFGGVGVAVVLDAVVYLGLLGVVEAVERSDKVAGDAADPFESDAFLAFMPSALGADIVDDAVVSAAGIAVDRMVDGTIADATFLHVADDLLEGIGVLGDIAIDFDIGDVSACRQRMIGRFDIDLAEHGNRIVDRDVEGIGVVIPIGDALDLAVALLVDADEAAREAFRRRGDDGEVEVVLLGGFLGLLVDLADDLQAEGLGRLAFAMVFADEGDKAFGKADEAKRQGTVADDRVDFVIPSQLVGIDPDALSHQEGHVFDLAMTLDFHAVDELLDDEVAGIVKLVEEEVEISMGFDAKAREVDGGEGEVSTAAGDFVLRVPVIAHDAGTAAHVGDFGIVVAGLVILLVEGGIEEGEVREEPLSGADDGFAE